MRRISYKIFIALSLVLAVGFVNAYAKDGEMKLPKNMAGLSIKADKPYAVLVDGIEVGKAGVGVDNVFFVEPGVHNVQIVNPDPNGKSFAREYTFRKGLRECICLKTNENVTKRPCPYNINVDAPEKVWKGDLVTFAAFNAVTGGATALNYAWKVTPDTARITSGLGTPSITVDTSGVSGGQTVRAELDVTDGVFDKTCGQMVAANVAITEQEAPKSFKVEEFVSRSFDDDKARLDAFAQELQNRPDSAGYIIVYQGNNKSDMRKLAATKLASRSLTYLVQNRGVSPSRLQTTEGGFRERTMYEFWIIPPGANPPVATSR
jgi:hypothetical protein